MEDLLVEELSDRFPFLFPGLLNRKVGPRGEATADPISEEVTGKLMGFLSAISLAYFFHRIGHEESLSSTVQDAIRKNSGRSARRLQERLLLRRPGTLKELFSLPGGNPSPEWEDISRCYRKILQGKDSRGLASLLVKNFRSQILGVPESEGKESRQPEGDEIAFDPVASHALQLQIQGSVQIPLFPFLALGQDGRLYLFQGYDGQWADFILLAGSAQRRSRDSSVRKCLAEYYLQMASYSDSRRIFDGLRGGGPPSDHRGLWAAVYGSLGDRFFRQGRYTDAARILERALLHRPNIPAARFQLGEAYRHLGKLEEAEKVVLSVLERYPNLERAQVLLEKTRSEIRNSNDPPAVPDVSKISPNGKKQQDRIVSGNPIRRNQAIPARPGREIPIRDQRRKIVEFLIDMTADAEQGRFLPLIGREREMRELFQVLSCRDKKNPLLVGDAGVGKTAIVEELARHLIAPAPGNLLEGKRLFTLNIASLLAGAKYRGEFEERMLEILETIRQDDSILYVDHIHTLIQPAHSRGTSMDAGGLLKGPLIRGEIQMIGTTSYEDAQNSLDKDPTLSRCFQRIPIDEPDREEAGKILVGLKGKYEKHHRISYEEEALRGSLEAIQRFLPEGNFPDKALDVADRAGARVSLEIAAGLRSDRVVREPDLLATIADMARIPSSRISQGFRRNLRGLEPFLGERIIGQEEAIRTVSQVLRSSSRGMKLHPERPNGVFLFLGPTGVGKTELARAMSEGLFGGTDGLIRIDMSEYMDRISTSRLIGAAPGYVGYNDLNQLTDKVRRRPYSLILLDEVEKADPQAMQLFLQVFDAGRLTDGRGRTISFGASTIVMTTNLGSELYTQSAVGYSQSETPGKATREMLRKELMNRFPPEFLNRIDEFIFFRPLVESDVLAIARLQLRSIREEMVRQGIELVIKDEALGKIAARGYSPLWGARGLGRSLRREILDPLASISLNEEWPRVDRVVVDRNGEETTISCFDSGRRIFFESVPPSTSS